MTLFAQSKGLLARANIVAGCLNQALKPYHKSAKVSSSDAMVGWGLKPHTLKFKQQALKQNINFIHLEDGFIGYIGHPAKDGLQVSLIADKLGIYYQSQMACELEVNIAKSLSEKQTERARQLIELIKQFGITKYNCYPYVDAHLTFPQKINLLPEQSYVLVVDQVAGDQSVAGAQATENDFLVMLETAKKHYPDSVIVVRTHPDTRLGKKRGILANVINTEKFNNVQVCDQHCHPHSLINHAEAVFTVSSQMGFEALILGKKVFCFGLPFYAGWGLTHDAKQCERRQNSNIQTSVSLHQLVYAALIDYSHYYNPVTQTACEVEEIIELVGKQQYAKPSIKKLYLVGFSLWKRSFINRFCQHLADELVFTKQDPIKLTKSLAENEQILVWGNKFAELKNVIRVEDGFIRSSGLGSNLCKPSSLCVDHLGMYFNAERISLLEERLMNSNLSSEQYDKAEKLLALVKAQKVSKYNLASNSRYHAANTDKSVLLVVGQVENDASILTGSPVIRSNQQLLQSVRQQNPNSWIIYKPHPDVIAKNRNDDVAADAVKQYCDELILDIPLNQLFCHIDELHTMTSLSGFEALVQGIKVVCWGQPFYSGWGLTEDKHPLTRRSKNIDLPTLVYHTLNYPKYIDWNTGLFVSPEAVINLISKQIKHQITQSFLQRWHLKFQHLIEALSYQLNN